MASPSVKGENWEKLTDKFLQLRSDALKQGLNEKQVREVIEQTSSSSATKKEKPIQKWRRKIQTFICDPAHRVHIFVTVLAIAVALLTAAYHVFYDSIELSPCLVEYNVISEEICRPVVDCSMCRDVYSVPEEKNISADDFYQKYAFTGRPVLVKEATSNWTAMSHFSFQFFRQLYKRTRGSLKTLEEECQFFPYLTEFHTLTDAFKMSEERATFQPGEQPWYIGWSNCHEGVSKKLREHYQRPYFLPADSDTVAEDWIFMGGTGPGANIHLDYVYRPSWQAQISGQKTWQLVPTPECESVCHSFNVTVHKGDIIVLDTNIWYHSTFVHPGEISITIGSEFD